MLANVGGVFLVLGFGCLFALIVAIIEFLWNVKKIAVEEKVRKKGKTIKDEDVLEVNFMGRKNLNLWGMNILKH